MFSRINRINVPKVVYAALSGCHVYGAIVTDKPFLYGTVAALYAVLALTKK